MDGESTKLKSKYIFFMNNLRNNFLKHDIDTYNQLQLCKILPKLDTIFNFKN